jgi:hypothetical protein
MKVPPCITLVQEGSKKAAHAAGPSDGLLGRLIRSTAESLVRWYPPLHAYSNPLLRSLASFIPAIGKVYDAADRYCEGELKGAEWEKVKAGKR